MSFKVHGYLLFYLGIVVIVLSVFSVYQVFIGSQLPIQLFHLPAFNLDSQLLSPGTAIELIPASINNQFANLFAHVVLMSFVSGIGYKLSLLGVQLLRPINIQVRESRPPPVS